MIRVYPGSLYPEQLIKYNQLKALYPKAIILKCSDERTGIRFGQSKKRLDQCAKIGSGGRSPGSRIAPYQLWITWSPFDLLHWSGK